MNEFWEQVQAAVWVFFSGPGKAIAWALAILFVGLLLIAVITKTVQKSAMKNRKIDNSAASFVTSAISLIAYVGLLFVIIGTLGFSTENIIAAFSSVMLAIALGLQNTLASLANGILLIFSKPFQAGDYVDIGGTSGTVKEIKLFSVKIVTPDNLTIVIPNNTVFGSTIINYSKMPLRRIDILLPVSYDVDVEKLKSLVNEFVAKDPRIVKEPSPFFRLTEYDRGALKFTLRAWTNSSIYWDVRFDLLEGILALLRQNGMEIPFEQLDVRVRSNEEV